MVKLIDVPGFDGLYQAGDDGFIYSSQRRGVVKLLGGRDKDGYSKVILCKLGKRHYFRTHVAVARSWIGVQPDGSVVAHKDGDLSNNRPENLKYCTQKENIADKDRHGTKIFGESHTRAILSEAQAIEILGSKENDQEVAERYGVSRGCVYCLRTARTWKHLHKTGGAL